MSKVKDIRVGEILLFCAFIIFTNTTVLNAETNQTKREVPFTLEDRDRIIRIETKLSEIEIRIETKISEMEKRFNERFEQMEKRINEKFEQIDKRFEDINRRFEDINKRFDQMMTFMWILASVFAGIVAVTISFAIWDRRTMIRPFEEKVKKIEKDIQVYDKEIMESKEKLSNLISALKDLAKDDEKLAEILKKFNLL